MVIKSRNKIHQFLPLDRLLAEPCKLKLRFFWCFLGQHYQNQNISFNRIHIQEEQNRLSCLALNDTPSGGGVGGVKARNKVGKSKSFRDTTGQKKASGGHQRSMSRYRYKLNILVVKEVEMYRGGLKSCP